MTETVQINGRPFKVVAWGPAPKGAARKLHRMIERPLDGEARSSGVLLLSVAPPSVNSLFHNRTKGRGKTLAYRTWRAQADRELRAQPSWHVPGKVSIVLRSNAGSDLDNRSKALLDALVGAGRIQDDSPRYVVRLVAQQDDSIAGARIEIEAAV
jgi:Holliday junction resolvase RusA-like endonuclease